MKKKITLLLTVFAVMSFYAISNTPTVYWAKYIDSDSDVVHASLFPNKEHFELNQHEWSLISRYSDVNINIYNDERLNIGDVVSLKERNGTSEIKVQIIYRSVLNSEALLTYYDILVPPESYLSYFITKTTIDESTVITSTNNYTKTITPLVALKADKINEYVSLDKDLILDSPTIESVKSQNSITLKDGFSASATSAGGDVNLSITTIDNTKLKEDITYTDGLGRTTQVIAIAQSTDKKDVIQFSAYDDFGREAEKYLPFVVNQNSGELVTDVISKQLAYYQNKYNDNNSYSEIRYKEGDPFNEIIETSNVGETWKMDLSNTDRHTIKIITGYSLPEDEEILSIRYGYSRNGVIGFGINPNKYLHKTIVKNENWKTSDDKLNTTESYSDDTGKEVATVAYRLNGTVVEKLTSYNVFDKYGKLMYILPAKYNKETADYVTENASSEFATAQELNSLRNQFYADQTILDKLAYQYKYDNYNRQIAQKSPEKGWEYVVYDNADRPVFTQDANLRENNKWMFIKYDVYNRPIYNGIYSADVTREALQTNLDTHISTLQNNVEAYSSTQNLIGGVNLNYSNNAFPDTDIEILTVNYYDGYGFKDTDKPTWQNTIKGQAVTTRTNGLLTAEWIKTLDQNIWTKTYHYYNEEGSSIGVVYKNHLGGYNKIENILNFRAIITSSELKHKYNTSGVEIIIKERFEYDHDERLIGQYQKINNQPEERIGENEFDDMGLLSKKYIGGKASEDPLQTENYEYNIRGWLKQVNDVDNLGDDLFAYKLNRQEGAEGTTVTNLYDGLITQTQWKSKFDDIKKSYAYEYDYQGQLTKAAYGEGSLLANSTKKFNIENIEYDANGNILNLKRYGGNGVLDDLVYNYGNTNNVNGNQLLKVTDNGDKTNGFYDGTNTGDDYDYDVNGNLIKDNNKGITTISYNHLDRVSNVNFSNGKSISYTYNATGSKLTKIYNSNNTTVSTDYVGVFQYVNSTLQFFPTAKGYVYPENGIYKYAYNITDNLGNNKVTYTDADNNGTIAQSEIISNTDYYPFGMQQSGEFRSSVASNYNYKYQGKEYQEEGGINLYDFGSRVYDASTGRWFATDPQNQFGSPYLAMANNPISNIDPNGELAITAAIVLGAYISAVTADIQGEVDNFGDVVKYAAIGAAGGAAGAGAGGLVGGVGFYAGASSGALGGAASGFTGGFLNTLNDGGSFKNALSRGSLDGLKGGLTGGLISGVASGISAVRHHGNFFSGKGALYESVSLDPSLDTDKEVIIDERLEFSNEYASKFSDANYPDAKGVNKLYADGTIPKSYTTKGSHFINDKGKAVLGVTEYLGFSNGKSNVYLSKLAFVSPAKLTLVMGHEYLHVGNNYGRRLNRTKLYKATEHNGIYKWQSDQAFEFWNSGEMDYNSYEYFSHKFNQMGQGPALDYTKNRNYRKIFSKIIIPTK